MFVLAPFAGVWVDRVNRHRLLLATQILSMLQSLALAAFALTHTIAVAHLVGLIGFAASRWLAVSLVCLALVGMGAVLLMASSNTLVQTLVDDDKRGPIASSGSSRAADGRPPEGGTPNRATPARPQAGHDSAHNSPRHFTRVALNEVGPAEMTTMKTFELNHVALHVQDVEASCEFYRDVLQLEPIPRPAFDFPGAWFRLGVAQELHLIGKRDEPVISGHRGNHFALRADDLDEWERHLKKHDVEFLPRKRRPDGAAQVFLRDPDGHVVELFTPPEAPEL